MPNTFVSHSKLHARLFWIAKCLTHRGRVAFAPRGKLHRRYYVAWA